MKQLVLILGSLLCIVLVTSIRAVYLIEIKDIFLWFASLFASWICIYAIGYTVSAIQHSPDDQR